MDTEFVITQMANTAETIRSVVAGISVEQAGWKPNEDSWSILEVINHLFDEEREDFRVRLEIILFYPEKKWPPIDPQSWVLQKGYNNRDLSRSVQDFLGERQKSLNWLKGLKSPDWQCSVLAPWGQPVNAGDIFAAWAAHDLLHLRQLVELRWTYTLHAIQPYNVNYAGEW